MENSSPNEMDIDSNAISFNNGTVEDSKTKLLANESTMDIDDTTMETGDTANEAHATVPAKKKQRKQLNPPNIDQRTLAKPKGDTEESRKQYNSERFEYLIRIWDNLDDAAATRPLMGSVARKNWTAMFDLKHSVDGARDRYVQFRPLFLADYGPAYPADIHVYYDQIKQGQRSRYVHTRPFPAGPVAAVPPAYAQLQVIRHDGSFDGCPYLPLQAIAQPTSKFKLSGNSESFVPSRFQVSGADTAAFERCIQCIYPGQWNYIPRGMLETTNSLSGQMKPDITVLFLKKYSFEDLVQIYTAAKELDLADICDNSVGP
jgi:hypothetical protein